MVAEYRNINFKVTDLIFYFKYKIGDLRKSEEVIQTLNKFSQYEYLYFVNEVLLHVEINIETFSLFFSISYEDYDGTLNKKKAKDNGVIENIFLLNQFNFDKEFNNYLNDDILERILNLYHIKNSYQPEINILENEIVEKLYHLKEVKDIEIISKEIDEIFDPVDLNDPRYPYQDILYKEEKRSLFDKIIDGIKYERFNMPYLDYAINSKINQECLRALNLFDLSIPRYHVFSFLVNDIEVWKKQVANNLLNDDETFEKKKLIYLESIDEFARRTNQNYIRQVVFKQRIIRNKGKIDKIWSPNIILLSKLKEWINSTFKSYDEIKDLDLISVVDKLPTKNKIIISSQFSQKAFLNLLIHFFSSLEMELDDSKILALNSFVSNFTTFSEVVHHKKYIERVPYYEVDFIPKKNYKDFIRIFLIFHNSKNKIIISKIPNTQRVLTTLFYNKETNHGLTLQSIRKIDNLKIGKELKLFKSNLRSILSSLNRDYFLP